MLIQIAERSFESETGEAVVLREKMEKPVEVDAHDRFSEIFFPQNFRSHRKQAFLNGDVLRVVNASVDKTLLFLPAVHSLAAEIVQRSGKETVGLHKNSLHVQMQVRTEDDPHPSEIETVGREILDGEKVGVLGETVGMVDQVEAYVIEESLAFAMLREIEMDIKAHYTNEERGQENVAVADLNGLVSTRSVG